MNKNTPTSSLSLRVFASAGEPECCGMDIADVKPLLLHLPVRQDTVPGKERATSALAVAQHLPEAGALEQEYCAVAVGEVGGVEVAARMVSTHHGREDVPDVFGKAEGQAAGVHVKGEHL